VNTFYCDHRSKNAQYSFNQYGFQQIDSESQADMLWIRKGFKQRVPTLKPNQLINHFLHESVMINKGFLAEALGRYDRHRDADGISLDEFYPQTFFLNHAEERKRFMAIQPETDHPDNLWIFKPGGESCGRGIEIIWKIREFEANNFYTQSEYNNPNRIIQRYIPNPMLLYERKFDLRVYWLIASIDPILVLAYPEAKVRLAGMPYSADQYDNPLVHMTNYYQQKQHQDFDPSLRYKITLGELDSYLLEMGKTEDTSFTQNQLMPKIHRCLAFVVRAGLKKLKKNYPKRGDCFGIYGADFLLDEHLNPYLTEIQKGPGLRMGDEVEQKIIPHMLGQGVSIAMQVRQQRIEGQDPSLVNELGNYRWVLKNNEEISIPPNSYQNLSLSANKNFFSTLKEVLSCFVKPARSSD